MELSINTKQKQITLDGNPLDTVTDIAFKWSVGKRPQITIACDLDVSFDGCLPTESIADVKCPHCGFSLGKISGHFHALTCPHCGQVVNSTNADVFGVQRL